MFAVVLLLTSLSFLLQTTKKVFAESGYLSTTIENTVAHFQDGSVLFRATQTKPTYQPVTMQIFDPKANVRVFVDDITRSVTTVTLPQAVYADMQSQLSFEGCPSQVDLAKLPDGGRILGLETKYYIEKTGTETDEQWIVPQLNCLILKEVEISHELGGAHNEINATSIRFGEPSSKLKDIPALYAERDPSEVNRLHVAATGQGKWGPAGLQILNRYYSALRK